MSEWIAKHPDELRPGLYVPVQALQEADELVLKENARLNDENAVLKDSFKELQRRCDARVDVLEKALESVRDAAVLILDEADHVAATEPCDYCEGEALICPVCGDHTATEKEDKE